jgi:glycosyltransferase involved in cell wall biosynthesis
MSVKVSLIIPVYNVEDYLRQCLDSVENQSYSDLQVILVNDGSTDYSCEICKEYVKRHSETWILINQKNEGLSSARNTGLSSATGDCIAFLDSDDWIDSEFITTLVHFMDKTGADIVESGIRWRYPDKERIDVIDKAIIYDMREALGHYLLQTQPIHSAVWCKLYRREIFHNLTFAVGKLHEDGYFTYRAMFQCEKYAVIDYVGYNYRQNRKGSIMTETVKPQNIIDVMDMMEERVAFFKEQQELVLAEKAASYYYRTALTNYVTVMKIIKDNGLGNKIKQKLENNRKEIFKNKYLGVKKLKFLYFFYFPKLFLKRY